jgi:hypothetical protein
MGVGTDKEHEKPLAERKGMKRTSPASVGYAKLLVIEGTNPLPMDEFISVGFGSAMLLRNGQPVWMEDRDYEYSECLTVKQAESMASLYPEDDWRIHLVGPLSEFYYQRQGKEKWLMYERGQGFA